MGKYVGKYNRLLRTKLVKEKVKIPTYFKDVILPQMGSYYDTYGVDFDAKPVVCCPLHDENTPSFRYYEESNSFYCFGCSRGGNVVTLHRYFVESLTGEQPDYDETVDMLYNTFLGDDEELKAGEVYNGSISVVTSSEESSVSSESELADFEMYVTDIDGSISADATIPMEKKKKVYMVIDDVTTMVLAKEVNAKKAKEYLKELIDKILKV